MNLPEPRHHEARSVQIVSVRFQKKTSVEEVVASLLEAVRLGDRRRGAGRSLLLRNSLERVLESPDHRAGTAEDPPVDNEGPVPVSLYA